MYRPLVKANGYSYIPVWEPLTGFISVRSSPLQILRFPGVHLETGKLK
jgi:hypothetical protein